MAGELRYQPSRFPAETEKPANNEAAKPGKFVAWLRNVAKAYGPIIAVLFTSPVIFYFGVQPPSDDFTGLLSVDGPLPAAVRAVSGPEPEALKRFQERVTIPVFVKGIYVSAAAAGTEDFFSGLTDLVDRTVLNTVVIDVKNDRGEVAFRTEDERLSPYVSGQPPLGDLPALLEPLREKGIYLVARIAVFQDPNYAERHPESAVLNSSGGLWRDQKGISWVDPASREAWEYNVAVAEAAVQGGFDEVQFDYVRFPTDGALSQMRFTAWDGKTTKEEVIGGFFDYLNQELRVSRGIVTSVDLFGLVTVIHDSDLNIGQRLVRAARDFDFISPMVYPSHYPTGFDGYANPALYPYEVVFKSMSEARKVMDPLHEEDRARRLAGETGFLPAATMRPWLQDFDLGADYTPEMIREQMRAVDDAGGSTGWLLWNARNVYTEEALGSAGPVAEN